MVLDFTDTLLLHKSSSQTGGSPYRGQKHGNVWFAAEKTLPNQDDFGNTVTAADNPPVGRVVGVQNNNPTTVGLANAGVGGNTDTFLECWRPVIYESHAQTKTMHGSKIDIQGARISRQVPSLIVAGEFKIRMHEGINNPNLWVGTSKRFTDMVLPLVDSKEVNGAVQYGDDGFASVQYVRAFCIKVFDMGKGLGRPATSTQGTIQDVSNPNFRNDQAAGVAQGMTNTCNMNLLAPSLGDIFDAVKRDPDNDYATGTVGDGDDEDFRNEDMIHWKYKTKSLLKSTPKAGQPNDTVVDNPQFFDPLRGSAMKRKFHILYDKKFAFKAGGSQSLRVNDQGAKEVNFKWSYKIRNWQSQQDFDSVHVDVNHSGRVRENANVRIFWYFIASTSCWMNGLNRVAASATPTVPGPVTSRSLGHHSFTVHKYPEKVFWTEKCS